MNPENSATDRELDQFYGTPPTEAQVQESIARFTEAFDADDLQAIAYENSEFILSSLKDKNYQCVGMIFNVCRNVTIAEWVSKELYGKTGVITAKDIK